MTEWAKSQRWKPFDFDLAAHGAAKSNYSFKLRGENIMSKQNNIRIFQDTMNLIETYSELRRTLIGTDIAKKNTFLYIPNPKGTQRVRPNIYATIKSVTRERTIECITSLKRNFRAYSRTQLCQSETPGRRCC